MKPQPGHLDHASWRVFFAADEEPGGVVLRRIQDRKLGLAFILFLFLIVWLGGFAVLAFSALVTQWRQTHEFSWMAFGPGMVSTVAALGIIWVGMKLLAQESVSCVQIRLGESSTVLSYFNLFSRHIPALPSHIEIRDYTGKFRCKSCATLRFPQMRTSILLLIGQTFYDTPQEARRHASEAVDATNFARLLHVEPKLIVPPNEDRVTLAQRMIFGFLGLLSLAGGFLFAYPLFHADPGAAHDFKTMAGQAIISLISLLFAAIFIGLSVFAKNKGR